VYQARVAAVENTEQSTAPLHKTFHLVLYRWGRVLQSPFPSPNLRRHYTCEEGYSQDHCLAAKAHSRTGSCDPLELEVDHAEPTSCPSKC
jgi:hypothetical protein